MYEKLKYGQEINTENFVSRDQIIAAIKDVLKHIDLNMTYFGLEFPTPNTFSGQYKKMLNTEWTNGFWTGILWLAYQYSHEYRYYDLAINNAKSFANRINHQVAVDNHDLGFLYTTSIVSAYKITHNPKFKQIGLNAAEQLTKRYQQKGGFIQAWGKMKGEDNYRLIVDSLMNIPLLYWAESVTGNSKFGNMADSHYTQVVKTIVRDNGSTYHTFYFDKNTGLPLRGATHQGYSDDSSWARGQAWAIYGISLHYKYRKNNKDMATFAGVTNYFLNRLPKDYVPYWDLIFGDGDKQPRDSSSAVIAICGIMEMLKYLPESYENKYKYEIMLHKMMSSIINNYANKNFIAGAPLLDHGVYSWRAGNGVDEGNLWGDYFYFEALIRFYEDWYVFW
ncbi:glycoside hydrolase family 88 protein [Lactobacillus sp. ESL0791]|uniref:glycoside hydrolase family 88 protein n=1 Tax=Lactobacillus sp. ESL0791 TaxID=2983234 RepID=UPI0023F894D7|nr:glycoside hydrolase family 88 protein [Lactobacillus sp. ESL0791]MDF7637907.1 glycoside hydrolase family 88 protein [Lactobacillus sp. ESL0791]